MYHLPPIKHGRLPQPVDCGSSLDSLPERDPESFRRLSEPGMRSNGHTEIIVTHNNDPEVDVFDLQSLRGVMGSPIPRSLANNAQGMDKTITTESRQSGHPKITIDTCADMQKTYGQNKSTPRDLDKNLSFGQPITRSVSANNLLFAPSPLLPRRNKLPSTASWNEVSSGLAPASSRSEGSIPTILSMKSSLQKMHQLDKSYGHKVARCRVRCCSDETEVDRVFHFTDSEPRPSSPLPGRSSRSQDSSPRKKPTSPNRSTSSRNLSPFSTRSRKTSTGSPTSPTDLTSSPKFSPVSPTLSPIAMTRSRKSSSESSTLSTTELKSRSPSPSSPIQSTDSPKFFHGSPKLRSRSSLSDSTTYSLDNVQTTPARKQNIVSRSPVRLLPLNCDRQDV